MIADSAQLVSVLQLQQCHYDRRKVFFFIRYFSPPVLQFLTCPARKRISRCLPGKSKNSLTITSFLGWVGGKRKIIEKSLIVLPYIFPKPRRIKREVIYRQKNYFLTEIIFSASKYFPFIKRYFIYFIQYGVRQSWCLFLLPSPPPTMPRSAQSELRKFGNCD